MEIKIQSHWSFLFQRERDIATEWIPLELGHSYIALLYSNAKVTVEFYATVILIGGKQKMKEMSFASEKNRPVCPL